MLLISCCLAVCAAPLFLLNLCHKTESQKYISDWNNAYPKKECSMLLIHLINLSSVVIIFNVGPVSVPISLLIRPLSRVIYKVNSSVSSESLIYIKVKSGSRDDKVPTIDSDDIS